MPEAGCGARIMPQAAPPIPRSAPMTAAGWSPPGRRRGRSPPAADRYTGRVLPPGRRWLAYRTGAVVVPVVPCGVVSRIGVRLAPVLWLGLAPVVLEPVARSTARPTAVPGGLPRVPSAGVGALPVARSRVRWVAVLGGLPGVPSRWASAGAATRVAATRPMARVRIMAFSPVW